MLCRGEANTRRAYLAAMIGGGGCMKTYIIAREVTEDVEEAGLGSIE